jgi:hypothetical protein
VTDLAVRETPIEGGCECGAVARRVAGPFLDALDCHELADGLPQFEELPD